MASIWLRGLFVSLTLVSAAAMAQEPMPVAPGQPWTHAHSGIVIPAALDELPRVRATSFVAPELDLSQNFASDDGRESLTIAIFRNTNGSVPVWFAQAERAIGLRADLKNPVLAVPVTAFTPPGQSAASGLKAVFAPVEVDGIRSTGVALFAVGDWYVKLRANSATLTPADMALWMEGVLGELTLPRGTAPAAEPIAEPIADCASKLIFADGATVDSPLADALLTTGVKQPAPRLTATRWCLDSVVRGNQALYRPDGSRDAYLLAVGDTGRAFAVAPQGSGAAVYYSVDYLTARQTYLIAAQDRMPPPQRILDLTAANHTVAAIATWPVR